MYVAKMPCKYDHTNNSIELLFIMRCKGVLTLISVDKILNGDLSNESY